MRKFLLIVNNLNDQTVVHETYAGKLALRSNLGPVEGQDPWYKCQGGSLETLVQHYKYVEVRINLRFHPTS